MRNKDLFDLAAFLEERGDQTFPRIEEDGPFFDKIPGREQCRGVAGDGWLHRRQNYGKCRARHRERRTSPSNMQSINRVIRNPIFFMGFIDALFLLPLSTWLEYKQGNTVRFQLLLAATIVDVVGVFGVTAAGNIPLGSPLVQFLQVQLLCRCKTHSTTT
jgi:hypothetical protein